MNNATLINQTSGKVEWYTDPKVARAAHLCMGRIDLDPASCTKANQIIRAYRYYTKEDNGLSLPWGSVEKPTKLFMNHPFGEEEYPCKPKCVKKTCVERGHHNPTYKPGNKDWIAKLVSEWEDHHIDEACVLCFASTSETWFQPLLNFPICFVYPRLNYLDENLKPVKGATKGSVIAYLGDNLTNFCNAFMELGRIKR